MQLRTPSQAPLSQIPGYATGGTNSMHAVVGRSYYDVIYVHVTAATPTGTWTGTTTSAYTYVGARSFGHFVMFTNWATKFC